MHQKITFHLLSLVLLALLCQGCSRLASYNPQPVLVGKEISNPVLIPMLDRSVVMDEISDELDDYFRISREEHIRVVDNLMTEGWIETYPRIGSTVLEPWHHDSTRGFEKLHASLQTVRRIAKVRIIPTGDSYSVDVKVIKELEDNPNPLRSAVSGKFLRHDTALDASQADQWAVQTDFGWISMGRDISLEQKILTNIVRRLSGADVTSSPN